MNGRTAKRIRRAARQMGVGLPERSPEFTGTEKAAPTNKDGKPQHYMVRGFNNADTTRGIYRYLKKQFKAARHAKGTKQV